jgi:hypothetical protein
MRRFKTKLFSWDLWFSQRWLWRVNSFWIQRRIVHWKSEHVSEKHRVHLQVQRISRARNQRESRWQAELYEFYERMKCSYEDYRRSATDSVIALLATCFHAGFLLGLFFEFEDGGNMFLRKVSWLSTHYTALYLKMQSSSNCFYLFFFTYLAPYKFKSFHGDECSDCGLLHHSHKSLHKISYRRRRKLYVKYFM